MARQLVLVGGGHAHLTVLANLRDFWAHGHRVAVVTPSPYQYYSGMGPGLLSGLYRPQQARFNIQRLAEDRGATFIRDYVDRVDPDTRTLFTRGGERLRYDVASFNIGSHVPVDTLVPTPQDNVFPVKPVSALVRARRTILAAGKGQAVRIVVVGGGASGVEIAGNAWRLVTRKGRTAAVTLVAGSRLLSAAPPKVRARALASLHQRGIDVREGRLARELRDGLLALDDGNTIPYDVAIVATGTRLSALFAHAGLLTGVDGGLLVNECLQSVERPAIFGGGDCIAFRPRPLAKVGVYAVRQNPILHDNLLAALDDRALRPFLPQSSYLLILNMGDGKGIAWRNDRVWAGRMALWLKDILDRGLMRRFQLSGELDEPYVAHLTDMP